MHVNHVLLYRATLSALFMFSVPFTGCAGCDSENSEQGDMSALPDMSQDMPDQTMQPDADMNTTQDLSDTPDLGEDMADMMVGCTEHEDCPSTQYCSSQGECKDICAAPKDGPRCVRFFERLGFSEDEKDALFCNADAGECQPGCTQDIDCADDFVCTDDGICAEFTGNLTGEDPGGDAPAPFKAGVGNTLMQFPIGMSLGGYGTRAGDDGGRYSEALVSSHGQMHGLYARAILLDSGDRQIMLIRMPIIFPTAPLLEVVARRLQEKTGKDWRNSLVISGTHTHSGPGRFLHLPSPDNTVLPLGSFGTDNFHDQAFEWIADSAVNAAEDAMNDLSDARFGWEIMESFDTDDEIASDRWGATPPFDDNRILLMRVDDTEGNPRALLFSFGMHGTFFDNAYASGDAASGIERALESKFGEDYDTFVPTMFFNQNGGTMSPRGDRHGHRDNQKVEHIGYRFVNHVWSRINTIQTDRDVNLKGKTLRFPLGYEQLGYEPGEWHGAFGSTEDHKYGGLQCSVAGAEDNDYTTHEEPGSVRCIGIDYTMYNRPPTLFLRSQMTALNIDGLTIMTLPGEAAMELGWQVIREVSKAHDLDIFKLWTWGYAQDHQFYLTPSNLRGELPPFPGISTPMAPDDYPDYAFSYYQGGYEAGFTIWGGRMGDYLVDRAVDAAGRLLGEPLNLLYEEPMPIQYSPRGSEPFPVESTPEEVVGMIAQDVPDQVKRNQPMEFAWIGGDPGAEMPQAPLVTLEAQQPNDSFESATHTNTRPYTNREPLMLTRLRLDEDGNRREWVVHWEELKDFPIGIYRFKVEGHYLNDAGERVAYTTYSSNFSMMPDDTLQISEPVITNDTMSFRLSYAAVDNIDIGGGGLEDPARTTGSYRMRNPEVPTGFDTPMIPDEDVQVDKITVTLTRSNNGQVITLDGNNAGTLELIGETVDGRANIPTSYLSDVSLQGVPPGDYTLTVYVEDNYGNSGTMNTSITL